MTYVNIEGAPPWIYDFQASAGLRASFTMKIEPGYARRFPPRGGTAPRTQIIVRSMGWENIQGCVRARTLRLQIQPQFSKFL
jgi:hypothetical protein